MKRPVLLAILALVTLTLFGCGDSTPPPQLFTTQVLSTAAFDGDIENTLPPTVAQGNLASLIVGFDPVRNTETRAFLDFSLSTVPLNAIINSATLSIFINRIQFNGLARSVPVSIDLVSFDPPTLIGTDFNRPSLLTVAISPALDQADINTDVVVDITSLVAEAQRLHLPALQLRLVAQSTGGLIEVNDTNTLAPQLDVSYF